MFITNSNQVLKKIHLYFFKEKIVIVYPVSIKRFMHAFQINVFDSFSSLLLTENYERLYTVLSGFDVFIILYSNL